jgi:tRNA(fMet)-specific endonuclease VapC
MDKSLLDTDIFSEVLKGKNEAVARNALTYRRTGHRYIISSISVMEIVAGLQWVGRHDQVKRFINQLSAVEIIPFGQEAAVLAGTIHGDCGAPASRSGGLIQ